MRNYDMTSISILLHSMALLARPSAEGVMHLLQYAPHSQRPSRQLLLSWRLSAGRGSSCLGPRSTQPGPPPAK